MVHSHLTDDLVRFKDSHVIMQGELACLEVSAFIISGTFTTRQIEKEVRVWGFNTLLKTL